MLIDFFKFNVHFFINFICFVFESIALKLMLLMDFVGLLVLVTDVEVVFLVLNSSFLIETFGLSITLVAKGIFVSAVL